MFEQKQVRVEKAAASQVVDFMYDSFMQEATKIGDVQENMSIFGSDKRYAGRKFTKIWNFVLEVKVFCF